MLNIKTIHKLENELFTSTNSRPASMAGFDGLEFSKYLMFLIKDLKVGGLILFSQNIDTPRQIKSLCLSAQKYALSCGQPPLFISIDQEGGQVARLKPPFTTFPGNPFISDEKEAKTFAKITASELSDVGINMNFAPVMDVAPKNFQSAVKKRIFSHDPELVSKLGKRVIQTFQENKIMGVAKHFPGIGRTTADSHIDMPYFDVDMDSIKKFDLIPFKAAIESKAAGIMLSHILYTKIDPKWPASLSPVIAKKLLRKEMDIKGL